MCPPGTSQRGRGGGPAVHPVVLWGCIAIAAPIACPLLICAAPFIGAWKGPKMVKKTEWYKKRQRRKECHPPKPQKRQRRLSITDDCGVVNGRKKLATENQLQSLLFKLPYELRRQIYEDVVDNMTVHVVEETDKLRSYPCRGAEFHKTISKHCWAKPARLSLTGLAAKRSPFEYLDPGIGMLGLLMSCRRIYSEFVSVLYSELTFVFEGYRSMLSFCASILPNRFNSIRSIHFNNTTSGLLPITRQLGSLASYRALRKGTTRNSRLPVLPIDDTKHGVLNHILMLLKEMESLRSLKLSLDFFTMGPYRGTENPVLPDSITTLKDIDLSLLEVRIHAKWDLPHPHLMLVKRISEDLPFIELVQKEDLSVPW